MAVLRSPMAHARIVSVDVSAALEMPGVIAAYSGADLADVQGSLPCAWPVTPDMVHPDHHPLATDEVRYVGDGVAVVVARDRYAAADALEAISVEYEQLPAVVDMEAALAEGAPLVHSDKGTNRCFLFDFPGAGADYDETVAAAGDDAVVVKRRFRQQRLLPTPMEPRGVVVAPIAAADEYTVYSATQIPHILRVMLALTTGIPEQKIRVIAPDVGGGFGSKLNVYAEEVLCLVVAKQARPAGQVDRVAQRELPGHHPRPRPDPGHRDRGEEGRHAARPEGRAARRHGRLPAARHAGRADPRRVHVPGHLQDAEPTASPAPASSPPRRRPTPTAAPGGRRRRTPSSGSWTSSPHELGRDPMELRQQNWIKHEEFPYDMVAGLTYDSGNYEAATEKAEQMFDMAGHARGAAAAAREQRPGAARHRHLDVHRDVRPRAVAACSARCRTAPAAGRRRRSACCPTGKVEVVSGATPHGQGHHTAWSQIVADALGVPFDDVEVITGDTDSSPKGMDTYGSRSLVVGGVAIHKATGKVHREGQAHRRAPARGGRGRRRVRQAAPSPSKGSPEAKLTIQEVALATFAAHNLPDGMEPTLDSDYVYDPENFSYPHGTHLCAVEIDTETGFTKIRKYVCVDDVGKIVNPVIVEGQVHGGLAQGIAQALYEEAVYDDEGNLTTGSLVDYLVPAAPDLPHFDDRPHRDAGDQQPARASRASARPAPSRRRRRSSTPSSTRCGRSA